LNQGNKKTAVQTYLSAKKKALKKEANKK